MLPRNKKQTILIVDDNVTNLKVVMDYLQAYSFEILIARNGMDGLESAQIAHPDLILLDVQMPGLDGFEVCRRLKANPDTILIPVIFMTALTEVKEKVYGLELGAVDYVTKPIEANELLARVNTHLRLQLLQAQLQQYNEQLEEQVQERTAVLEEEIIRRKQQEAEKEILFQAMTQQSEHLRHLTQLFLENQQRQQQGLTQTLQEQVQQQMELLQDNLILAQNNLIQHVTDNPKLQLVVGQLMQAQSILAQLQQKTEQVTANLGQTTAENQILSQNPLLSLSAREREVLQLLVTGKSRRQIADMLVISPGTVSTYRSRIMEKLHVEDNTGLVWAAVEYKLA